MQTLAEQELRNSYIEPTQQPLAPPEKPASTEIPPRKEANLDNLEQLQMDQIKGIESIDQLIHETNPTSINQSTPQVYKPATQLSSAEIQDQLVTEYISELNNRFMT